MFYFFRKPILCLSVLMLVVFIGNNAAQGRKRTTMLQIEQVEAERAAARKNGDKNTLERLIADDFVETNRNGKVLSKADMLAEQAVQNLRVDDTKIRIYGDAAIVTGRASYVSLENVQVATRFTRVWVRREGKWLLVSHHGSTVNQQ